MTGGYRWRITSGLALGVTLPIGAGESRMAKLRKLRRQHYGRVLITTKS
jgi:hypothetical protein